MKFELQKFLFDTPIYSGLEIPEDEINSSEFNSLFYKEDTKDVEGYNPWEKVQSTFAITETLCWSNRLYKKHGGFASLLIECKRYHSQFRFYIYWEPKERFMIKVGQYPTVADFHLGDIKQYKKVISEEKLKEFTRAIGLAANGVGIGSFVYLRRIFEHLIAEAFRLAESSKAIAKADYEKARMDQRIELLKSFLPTFLVENKGMYSILSLGIHELDEKTCLAHFDTLKVGIEIILDEKLDEFRKKEKIEKAKNKLASLKGELKK
jgi:hypothetical protein